MASNDVVPGLTPVAPTDPEVAEQIIGTIRDWVRKEVIPVASEYEHADEFPTPLVEQMKAFGLFGAKVPEEYGGLGLDTVTYTRLMEELAYGWMSLAGVLNTHTIVVTLLSRNGTEEQKKEHLPRMATGEVRAAFSLSEPDAGSDAASLRCKATPDGDEYVINGTKMWVTNGERAALVALAARTPEGITCFIYEKTPNEFSESLQVSRTIEKLGYKGLETVEMAYNDHRIPASTVLGGPQNLGRGLNAILGGLELGRVNIAARAQGVGRAAYDAAMKYAFERETFGKPINQHQAIQFKLADMATQVEAARLLTLRAARLKDAGERSDMEAGMAKLFASEAGRFCVEESFRIHGGYGYSKEYEIERLYRDAPLLLIGEGTSEIQRMVIGKKLLQRHKI